MFKIETNGTYKFSGCRWRWSTSLLSITPSNRAVWRLCDRLYRLHASLQISITNRLIIPIIIIFKWIRAAKTCLRSTTTTLELLTKYRCHWWWIIPLTRWNMLNSTAIRIVSVKEYFTLGILKQTCELKTKVKVRQSYTTIIITFVYLNCGHLKRE